MNKRLIFLFIYLARLFLFSGHFLLLTGFTCVWTELSRCSRSVGLRILGFGSLHASVCFFLSLLLFGCFGVGVVCVCLADCVGVCWMLCGAAVLLLGVVACSFRGLGILGLIWGILFFTYALLVLFFFFFFPFPWIVWFMVDFLRREFLAVGLGVCILRGCGVMRGPVVLLCRRGFFAFWGLFLLLLAS